jgi:hypothetical protein
MDPYFIGAAEDANMQGRLMGILLGGFQLLIILIKGANYNIATCPYTTDLDHLLIGILHTMETKEDLSEGQNENGIDYKGAKSSDCKDETGSAEKPPRYNENEASTYHKGKYSQKLPMFTSAHTSGSKILSNGHADKSHVLNDNGVPGNEGASHFGQGDTVVNYFAAIRNGDNEAVRELLEAGVVNTSTSEHGLTPLLATIEKGHISTTRLLLEAGADPNAYGVVCEVYRTSASHRVIIHVARENRERWEVSMPMWRKLFDVQRTPLQYAAEKGNLPIVKLLMESYHADDALVAPDGELALRLASANGHREIVDYLPPRRGGGFRRWKTKHSDAMRRAKRAVKGIYGFCAIVFFEIPKFFVWALPKHVVVLPVVRRVRWLRAHSAELPRLVADGVKRFWCWLKQLPRAVWGVLKEVPGLLNELGKFVLTTIKGVPKATKIALLWMWDGFKTLGAAVGNVFGRLFSLLHTAAVAIWTFFRNITLRNIWDGFVAFIRALVVDGPKKLWGWMRRFKDVVTDMLGALWGVIGKFLGWVLWGIGKSVVAAFTYLPRKLWEILASVLNSVGYGAKEVMIWINPKR